jgi:hypothetical protein
MYAPAHVSTALAVKRAFPVAPLFGLMLAAQVAAVIPKPFDLTDVLTTVAVS